MIIHSKKLSKPDTSSFELHKYIFGAVPTTAIVPDAMFKTKNGWVILEYLRCVTVDVKSSDPHRYWNFLKSGGGGNWRKFVRLFEIAKQMQGEFYLINYEINYQNTDGICFGTDFKVFTVDMSCKPSQRRMIRYLSIEIMDIDKLKSFMNDLNNNSAGFD